MALCFFMLPAFGCKRSPSSSASPEVIASQALKWNLKTTVEAYDKAGTKNPSWDDSARKGLSAFAHLRAKDLPNEPWGTVISTNIAAAVEAGCTDPLVSYLYIRFSMPLTNSRQAFASHFYATAQAIHTTTYPAVRRFYAAARAMDQYLDTYDIETNSSAHSEYFELQKFLFADVGETMTDKTLPTEEAGEIASQALYLCGIYPDNRKQFYEAIEKPLMENRPNEYLPWYLQGNRYIELAWNARGSGYADTVTPAGWEGLRTNLVLAHSAFEHAWKLNPTIPDIAIQMLTVTMGQEGKNEEMELWFNRAMNLNTNSYEACRNKMNYLDPKWHGSDEEQLAFGRECAHSTKWGGRVPLMLVLAHNTINTRLTDSAKTNYWKRPEVWEDLQLAYDRLFALNPDETQLYQDYVRFAYRAEQWQKLSELLPKLATTNYAFFGGKAEFDKMVRLANEHK